MTLAQIAKKDPILAAQLRAAEIKAGVPAGTAERLVAFIKANHK